MVDRFVKAAYREVCEDNIDFFGQKRIMSFIPGREVYIKPLVFKLQEGAYPQYEIVRRLALAFICRSMCKTQVPSLSHSLKQRTDPPSSIVLSLSRSSESPPLRAPTDLLDRKCLDLCIAPLDQRLTGNIFDSVLGGFFAVLGRLVNNERNATQQAALHCVA